MGGEIPDGRPATAQGEAMPIGVVIERRRLDHPWQDHTWGVVDVIPGGPASEAWRLLEETPELQRYFVGGLTLSLYPGETAGYGETLAAREPVLFVVLRRGEGDHGVRPLLATACPLEAQAYTESGDDLVESVPMPPAVEAWIRGFVARHPAPAFIKRERDPKRRGGGRGEGPAPGGGGGRGF
jgi:hypothetical protein